MDENRQYIQMLIEILEKQIKALDKVLEVTREQSELADMPKFDVALLEETLSRKDVLIIQLNELDNGFVSTYDRVRKAVKDHPEQYKKDVERMQELIRRCTDLGNEIQTLETRNRDKLTNCFADKKQEYTAKQTAATVAGKYHATMRNGFTGSGYRFNQDQ